MANGHDLAEQLLRKAAENETRTPASDGAELAILPAVASRR
jgi:hypothetical protein